ncbi:glutathione S-transferase T3-like [Brassica napus]|uniref:glutathione S-transferase T3-like n=1 Tax=Brassica napus TaxID=3708 RepID=UPI000BBE6FD6|nr:glutathione S-transferase T3-like [Brassica napus]
MDYNPYSNYVDLLDSQRENVISLDSPPAPVFRREGTQDSSFGDSPPQRRERRTWSPSDDIVLISSWLNTSKDPSCSYFGANPKLAGCEKRESMHSKQRWHKINDLVCKFCGAYESAAREKTSGHNDNDILKQAHEIFYNNYKKKFTLEHAWKELRNDQKWRKLDDGAQSSTSHATVNKTGEADEGTVRPPGVKAAKRLGKKTMKEEKGLSEFKEIWSIKEEDMTRKERIVKMGLLDRLLAKPEPLPEYEESLKKKLISELF